MELCHVATASAWQSACESGCYCPDELGRDGFLHCCTEAQLGFVLARHFAGATGLVLLRFDPAEVPAGLSWVRSEPDQAPFPHLHGAIPVSAIRRITPIGG